MASRVFRTKSILPTLKNDLVFFSAGVVVVNSEVVGLGPGSNPLTELPMRNCQTIQSIFVEVTLIFMFSDSFFDLESILRVSFGSDFKIKLNWGRI
jgi:hypothetical protein